MNTIQDKKHSRLLANKYRKVGINYSKNINGFQLPMRTDGNVTAVSNDRLHRSVHWRPPIVRLSEQLDPRFAASRHTTAPISYTGPSRSSSKLLRAISVLLGQWAIRDPRKSTIDYGYAPSVIWSKWVAVAIEHVNVRSRGAVSNGFITRLVPL